MWNEVSATIRGRAKRVLGSTSLRATVFGVPLEAHVRA